MCAELGGTICDGEPVAVVAACLSCRNVLCRRGEHCAVAAPYLVVDVSGEVLAFDKQFRCCGVSDRHLVELQFHVLYRCDEFGVADGFYRY